MKKFICAIALLMFALPTFAQSKKGEPLNPDCHKMASNAKAFATLKITGVATTKEQFQSFVSTPTVSTYPIKAIVKYVYESNKAPDEVYQALYGRCMLMGYTELYSYFQDREAADVLRAQLESVNTAVANLQTENASLKLKLEELQKKRSRPVVAAQPSR